MKGETQSQRSKVLQDDYGRKDVHSCVLSGFHAPELAGGLLQQKIAQFQQYRRSLLHHMALTARAPPTEWMEVLADYEVGIHCMLSGFGNQARFLAQITIQTGRSGPHI